MAGTGSSNKVALLALFSLIPIFVFVIGNGWATILAPVLHVTEVPTFDRILSYVAGFLFGLVAVVLAWAVAGTAGDHEHVLLFFGVEPGEAATKDEGAEEEVLLHRMVG